MIIFIITVGIAAIISMFSSRNGRVKGNCSHKRDANKLDDFLEKIRHFNKRFTPKI